MKYIYLWYLYSSPLFLVCSSMETDKSTRLWPGRLKWAPVARLTTWLIMYPQWSAKQCFSWQPLVLKYLWEHFLHSNIYIIINDLQINFLFIFQTRVSLIFNIFLSFINRQAVQALPHFFMPLRFLYGYKSVGWGSLDFMRKFWRFALF